jgi:hypothetical protein
LFYLLVLLGNTLPKKRAAGGSRPVKGEENIKLIYVNNSRWNVKKQEGPPAGKITFTLWKLA